MQTSLSSLYDLLPIRLQNLAVSAVGMKHDRERYGKAYWSEREFLQRYDVLTIEDKLSVQDEMLRSFVLAAVDDSPFYAVAYCEIDLDSLRTAADLHILPILEKEALRTNIGSVVTIRRRKAIEGHTGGTTGKSLTVRYTRTDMMRRMALLDHFKSRHGFESRKMIRATFNGKHVIPPGTSEGPFWRYNSPAKQMIFSSFDLHERNLKSYVRQLNSLRPKAIDGFFSSILDVASFIERNDMQLDFRPVAVFPTSETVTRAGRETIQRVFRAPVYDQYSSSEGAPFITECRDGQLHIEMCSGIFEIRNECESSIVTSFTTHGTPLIRYRIGDELAASSNTACGCGMESLMVARMEGRSAEFLFRSDGSKINSANVANLFKNMPNSLIAAQARQSSMDEITLLLQYDHSRYQSEHDVLLHREFIHKFGPGTKLVLKHVTDVPREASGKLRLIVNTVDST